MPNFAAIAGVCSALAMFVAPDGGRAMPVAAVESLISGICSGDRKDWTETEAVDAASGHTPAYDRHHTVCLFEFVGDGRWFRLEYRHTVHVSRNWRWTKVAEKSLYLTMEQIDYFDEATGDIYRWSLADRGCKGQVSFGARGALGSASPNDRFHLPVDLGGGEECVASVCEAAGTEHQPTWQRLYIEIVQIALTQFGALSASMVK
jgi:hypothetical protein